MLQFGHFSGSTRVPLTAFASYYQMFKNLPLHAIFFSLFPVLSAFSGLSHYLLLDELYLPLIVSIIAAIVVLALTYAILKDWVKAGLVTSTLLLSNFSFDAMVIPGKAVLGMIGIHADDRIFLIPYFLVVTLIVRALLKLKLDFQMITGILNVLSIVLVLLNAGFISYHAFLINKVMSPILSKNSQEVASLNLSKKPDSPDIYYIILDAMGRRDTLKALYDYDNSEFLSSLEKRGFTLPAGCMSNYQMTAVSLPSSLNFQYMDEFEKLLGKESAERIPLYTLVQRNKTALALKKLGYRFVNIRSGWSPTDNIPMADANLGFQFGNIFHLALLNSTLLGPLQRDTNLLAGAAREVRIWPFQHAQQIADQKSPKFVFIHITMPHPPFLFKADGSGYPLELVSLSDPYIKERYVQQTKFVEQKVSGLLDVLDKDGKPKIIIMQGDHGPAHQKGVDGDPSANFLKERMRIFNAYKLPGEDGDIVYDGITPVNTFRVIFNRYFGAKLPLLEDRCMYSPDSHPYDFKNVTEQVKEGEIDLAKVVPDLKTEK